MCAAGCENRLSGQLVYKVSTLSQLPIYPCSVFLLLIRQANAHTQPHIITQAAHTYSHAHMCVTHRKHAYSSHSTSFLAYRGDWRYKWGIWIDVYAIPVCVSLFFLCVYEQFYDNTHTHRPHRTSFTWCKRKKVTRTAHWRSHTAARGLYSRGKAACSRT